MQGIPADCRVFQQVTRQEKKQKNKDAVQMEQLPSVLARQLLLPAEKLERAVSICDSPFLGVVPDVFSKVTKDNERNIVAGLDEIATQINKAKNEERYWSADVEIANGNLIELSNPIKRFFRQKIQKRAIQVDRVGSGFAGEVYKLKVNGQEFAIKVFREPGDATPEIATGLHYTQGRQTSNLSDFFAANPTNPGAPWALMEFIPETATLKGRAGQTLADQGIKISDDGDKNKVNGIRIDHGGDVTLLETNGQSPEWEFFKELANNVSADELIVLLRQGSMAKSKRLPSEGS